MSAKLDQLDKKLDEGPSIPSGIVTPEQIHELASPRGEQQQILVSAPSLQLVMSSGLPLFSGSDPTPRDESTYEQFQFQVKGMRSSCPKGTVRSALIRSVRGEVSELVSFLGSQEEGEIIVGTVKAGNKVPPMLAPRIHKEKDLKTEQIPEKTPAKIEKLFSKLDLCGMMGWSLNQKQQMKQVFENFHHLIALEDLELGKTDLVKHVIKLDNQQPFKERYRIIPPHQYEEVKQHLKEMIEIGTIRKSPSPWASAVILVRKKTGELRFCLDLRKLNAQMVKDAQTLPRIENSLDSLSGAVIFTSLDLKSGYWQVELDEDSIPLTAFTVGPPSFYECL